MVSGAKVSRAVNGERPRAATTPSATTTHAIAPARVGRCGDARGARGCEPARARLKSFTS
jgi:hypothetical protein|tara:strand:- start:876 stop:1055 length:180 start_codon:yes stop_codon:yes gene_type:complete